SSPQAGHRAPLPAPSASSTTVPSSTRTPRTTSPGAASATDRPPHDSRPARPHVPDQLHNNGARADIWAGYSPERVRAGLRRSAGAFRGLDREAFLADVKEQREQESTGRPA